MLRNRKECSLLIGRSFPLLTTRGNGEKLLPLVSLGVSGTSKLKVATIFSLYLSTRRRELFGTTSCRYVRGRAPAPMWGSSRTYGGVEILGSESALGAMTSVFCF
ncbi:hypothetical protein AVEN_211273-1 [Araneus ventricosus]|uniref:Uncharacterized protein n=1 Tax=Araneus ventricosus TaxID=182803 RepID=A0A4Y2NL04_ARAVE|nr:hypothetical protein AVEN_211273-1 [Araneus ventricosus]